MHQGLLLTIIDLFSYRVYGGLQERGYGIVNCYPRCTYCPLVPKQNTFHVTDGSPIIPVWKEAVNVVLLVRFLRCEF